MPLTDGDQPPADDQAESDLDRLFDSFDADLRTCIKSDCQILAKQLVASDGAIARDIVECVRDAHLVALRSKYSRSTLLDQLQILVGHSEPARFIVSMLEWHDLCMPDLLQHRLSVDESVVELIRKLYVAVGDGIRRASNARRRPKNWSTLRVDVGFDSEKKPTATLYIERNDGASLDIQTSVTSLLEAQIGMIKELSASLDSLPQDPRSTLGELNREIADWIGNLDSGVEQGD